MSNIHSVYSLQRRGAQAPSAAVTSDLFDQPAGHCAPPDPAPEISPDAVIIASLPAILETMTLAEIGMLHILAKCPGLTEGGAQDYAAKKGLPAELFGRLWRIHQATLSASAQPRRGKKAKPKLPQVGIGDVVDARLPLKDGSTVAVMRDFVETMISTYPGVDVAHEIQCAARWLEVNPTRRKTLQGMARFINTWMKNCHDRLQMKQAIMASQKENSSPFGVRSGQHSQGVGSTSQMDANMHLDALID